MPNSASAQRQLAIGVAPGAETRQAPGQFIGFSAYALLALPSRWGAVKYMFSL